MTDWFQQEAFESLYKIDNNRRAVKVILDNMNGYLNYTLKNLLKETSGECQYLKRLIGIEDERNSIRFDQTCDLNDLVLQLISMNIERDYTEYNTVLLSIDRVTNKIWGNLE